MSGVPAQPGSIFVGCMRARAKRLSHESAAMIRIVGGTARGRPLSVPGRGTRPTSDRAREALFNTLTGLIDLTGADVLDLYAGTGAVGLEALSRGAGTATLVESDPAVLSVLRSNVAAIALENHESCCDPRSDKRQLSDSAMSMAAVVGCIAGNPGTSVCRGWTLKP